MEEFIAIALILLIVGGASAYIIKAKKSGKKCIGCPYADACPSKGGTCNCKDENNENSASVILREHRLRQLPIIGTKECQRLSARRGRG